MFTEPVWCDLNECWQTVQAYVFLVILLLSVYFETYWSLLRNYYSSHVKVFIVMASTTSNSEKDFHDPSKASFDVIRLAGTVRFEAFTAVT
jgi:hypothetical protein